MSPPLPEASFGNILIEPWFAAGYVAGARAHGQSVVAVRSCQYPNGMISTVTGGVAWNISDRVLMANVPRDAPADGDHFAEPSGKKGFASRGLCQALEHTRVPVRIVFVEYTHRIDDGAGSLGQFHDLGQAMRAHVVTAIADDNQHFLIPAARLRFL